MYRAAYGYAWDLVDHGLDRVASELVAAGLNTLTLAGAYHAGKFLRPRGVSGKVYFPEDGTVYFRPELRRYGVLKPLASRLTAERDTMADLCRRTDIDANAWMVLLHNTRLGTAHPDMTVRNAFGDGYPYSLCPSHPDVRAFAVTLCADVTDRYAVSGLSLETPGFLPYPHGFHHEFAMLATNIWRDALLALCFCHHCRAGMAAAGIDGTALGRRVADAVSACLAQPDDAPADMPVHWLLADLVADADLVAALRFRMDVVTGLVREIRAAVRADASIAVIPSVARPGAGAWLEGSDLPALAAAGFILEVPFYEPAPARIAADIHDIRRRVGPAAQLRGILRPGYPDLTRREDVNRSIGMMAEAGITDFALYNYGMLRPGALAGLEVDR